MKVEKLKDQLKFLIKLINRELEFYSEDSLESMNKLLLEEYDCLDNIRHEMSIYESNYLIGEKNQDLENFQRNKLYSISLFLLLYKDIIGHVFINEDRAIVEVPDFIFDSYCNLDELLTEFIYCNDNLISMKMRSDEFKQLEFLIKKRIVSQFLYFNTKDDVKLK